VIRELKSRLEDQFLFASGYLLIRPERCLKELAGLDIPGPALDKLLFGNGNRLLGLTA
jgi:predicted TIM-barrel fold metal-dependent hydrolase